MQSKTSPAGIVKKGFALLGLAFLVFLTALLYYNLNFAYTIRGNVVLSETDEAVLPPGSRLIVQLEDVSDPNAARPIAEQTIEDVQLPAGFKIKYSPNEIESGKTYAVSADIYDKDYNLVFNNDLTYNVLAEGQSNQIEIQLVRTAAPNAQSFDEEIDAITGETSQASPTGTVTGNVIFDDSQALPADAFMLIRLYDTSLGDLGNNVISETTKPVTGSPETFELSYILNSVQEPNIYSLTVIIGDSEENILFRSNATHNVITNGNPAQVDIELVPAGPVAP